MWSDHESLIDYIDYQHLISAITTIIDNDNLLPCSIGIYGDWGSGKSSLMRMVEQNYEAKEDILVIKFNGWLFEGYEDAKTVLMGRIIDEIISKRTLTEKAIKFAAKLLKKIDWIKVAGATMKYGAGFMAAGAAGVALVGAHETVKKHTEEDYAKYIKDKKDTGKDPDETLRSNLQEFHHNFEELITETKLKKIIVFIDDLDRCSPDTIIGTLEAIKLFLFTKNTAFVIGADERLIKYAVRRRFPEVPGDIIEIGRDYLEKLIQYPVRIPPLSTSEMATYINLLFSKLFTDAEAFENARSGVISKKRTDGYSFVFDQTNYKDFFENTSNDLDEAIILCAQVVPVLAVGLNGNPRQVKRFLNTLLIRLNMAAVKGSSLKKRVLAKLMLLEYFKPETFTSFHDQQAANNGTLPILTKLEQNDAEPKGEQKTLTDDPWIHDWLNSEPKLAGENLQPYFYVSRDKLAITTINLQRMSPKAQDIIQKLLSSSQAVQTNVLKELGKLSTSDASSIFEALTNKIRQEESSIANSIAFKSLFDLVREKNDLKSQLITFLQKYPAGALPLTVVTYAEGLFKTSDSAILTELITKWTASANKPLAAVAKKKLK
jgi:predicted KAP-like P-loop ATPase